MTSIRSFDRIITGAWMPPQLVGGRVTAALGVAPLDRDTVLDAAISERRISASQRVVWAQNYDEAPGVARRVLASLPAGVVPEPEPEHDAALWAAVQSWATP